MTEPKTLRMEVVSDGESASGAWARVERLMGQVPGRMREQLDPELRDYLVDPERQFENLCEAVQRERDYVHAVTQETSKSALASANPQAQSFADDIDRFRCWVVARNTMRAASADPRVQHFRQLFLGSSEARMERSDESRLFGPGLQSVPARLFHEHAIPIAEHTSTRRGLQHVVNDSEDYFLEEITLAWQVDNELRTHKELVRVTIRDRNGLSDLQDIDVPIISGGRERLRVMRHSALASFANSCRDIGWNYGWSQLEAITFVLTGVAPNVHPISVNVRVLMGLDGRPMRSEILLESQSFLSADAVARAFLRNREQLGSRRTLNTCAICGLQSGQGRRLCQGHSLGNGLATCSSPQHSGTLQPRDGLYTHTALEACGCGAEHRERCVVCNLPIGRGRGLCRGSSFLIDGYKQCSSAKFAGSLRRRQQLFWHQMRGRCGCGKRHKMPQTRPGPRVQLRSLAMLDFVEERKRASTHPLSLRQLAREWDQNDNWCPVCHRPRNGGVLACSGFLSANEKAVHCESVKHKGALRRRVDGLYVHRLAGYCPCKVQHNATEGRYRDTSNFVRDYHRTRDLLLDDPQVPTSHIDED